MSTLSHAIITNRPSDELAKLIQAGGNPHAADVLDAMEKSGLASPLIPPTWTIVPALTEAYWQGEAAGQTAWASLFAFPRREAHAVRNALLEFLTGNDPTDTDVCGVTFLAIVVRHSCPVALIRRLIDDGADPCGFSHDAVDELRLKSKSPWKTAVLCIPAMARAYF